MNLRKRLEKRILLFQKVANCLLLLCVPVLLAGIWLSEWRWFATTAVLLTTVFILIRAVGVGQKVLKELPEDNDR